MKKSRNIQNVNKVICDFCNFPEFFGKLTKCQIFRHEIDFLKMIVYSPSKPLRVNNPTLDSGLDLNFEFAIRPTASC